MDERAVFEQFHEALEMEPRAGAYERFRVAFTTPPAAAMRRPVFRLRFSPMTLRIAAAVAVAAIAIALVAGFLAIHHSSTGYVPAQPDKNLKAYQELMVADYNNFNNSTSNSCNSLDDQTCPGAVAKLLPSMQKWVSDLTAFQTPPQLVILDGRLRAHLNLAMTELNSVVSAQQRHDQAGFTLAINAALYERAWLDPASFTLEGSYPPAAASYHDAIRLASRSLNSCVNTTPGPDALACEHIAGAEACLGAAAQGCADDIQSAETQLQNFIIAIAQNPPPRALAGTDRQFETALADADNTLLDLVNAQLSGNTSKVSADEQAYLFAVNNAAAESGTLANS